MKQRMLRIVGRLLVLAGLPGAIFCWELARPRQVGVLRAGVGELGAPVVRVVAWAARSLSDALEFVVASSQIRERNRVLWRRIAQLNAENAFLRESLGRYHRLDATAALAESEGWKFVEADAIAYGGRRAPHSLLLNRGSGSRIQAGDPVLHMEGLAGVVTRSGRASAAVQLLSDPQVAVGVLVLPIRAPGIVRGTGREDSLEIVLRDGAADLRPGYRVVSSGMKGSLYPRGLLVGTVGELDQNRFGQTIAQVRPAVDLNRIEEVLVLTGGGRQEPSARPWAGWNNKEAEKAVAADLEGEPTTETLRLPVLPATP